MKLLPQLLLSLVVTVAALWVYDRFVRGDAAPARAASDDAFLERLEEGMAEIERRRQERALRDMLTRTLTSAALELTDEQRRAVIETTMTFHTRLKRELGEAPAAERAARTAAVQREFKAALRALVPAETAERIVNSPLGRAVGVVDKRKPQ